MSAARQRTAAVLSANLGSVPRRHSWTRAGFSIVAALLVIAGSIVWQQQRTSSAPPRVDDPALSMPTGPAIAVLPLVNAAGDPRQDFFTDGITDQLINELSRFHNLHVIARYAAFSYKGRTVDVREVGRGLGVRYVVAGRLHRGGNAVRLYMKLLDSATGETLWSGAYKQNFKPAGILGVQHDIAERVVSAIENTERVNLRTQFEQSAAKGTSSWSAYECVLRSYAYRRVRVSAQHMRVRDCLERAVRVDPQYAEAWAALAEIYVEEHSRGYNARPDPLDRALDAAQRAVQLEPRSQRAYVELASAHFFRHEIDLFNAAANKAIALNPNSADTLAWAGIFVTYANQADAAHRGRGVAMMRKAIAMSPVYPIWYHFPIAWDYYYNGDYEKALAEARKIDMPDYYWDPGVARDHLRRARASGRRATGD